MQRTLFIAASIVVILGIAIGGYLLFFAPKGAELSTGNNPFANTDAGNSSGGSAAPDANTPVPGAGKDLAPSFVQITAQPVAVGFSALFIPSQTISTPSTTATTSDLSKTPSEVDVRYIDRASGNVYSYRFHQRSLTRLSNKTLPGVEHAVWLSNGTLAFGQYLSKDTVENEHVETYALPVSGEGGYLLERDIEQVLVASSSSLFTLQSNQSGSTGTLAKPDGSGGKLAFSTPLSSVVAAFAGKNLVVYTKPSVNMGGYGFTVDAAGTLTRTLGPLNGLSVLPSPSGKSLLYSYVDQGTLRLALLDVATRAATLLPVATLSEKCVWASDEHSTYCAVPTTLSGSLPDEWYQGVVSFSDRLWQIDLTSRVAFLLINPNVVAKQSIDAVGLTVDTKSDVLIFSDKKTGALYGYDL